jgi:hypothetical protein
MFLNRLPGLAVGIRAEHALRQLANGAAALSLSVSHFIRQEYLRDAVELDEGVFNVKELAHGSVRHACLI